VKRKGALSSNLSTERKYRVRKEEKLEVLAKQSAALAKGEIASGTPMSWEEEGGGEGIYPAAGENWGCRSISWLVEKAFKWEEGGKKEDP